MRSKKLLSKEKTALLVVDIQEKLAAAMQPEILKATTKNVIKLLKAAKELKLPIYVAEQYPKGLGKTLAEIASELAKAPVFEKMTFSSAQVSGLVDDLRNRNIPNVILAGMEAHVCVAQTALDLAELGFNVYIPADAVCSQRKMDYTIALERMRAEGVTITTTEAAIFELLYSADTPEFRNLRHIFKE